MYTSYFGIEENPFSITPDPRYLYMSQQHQEALGYLLYGVSESGGFVLLTGEVGAGKTTVCRCLMEQLPEHVDAALILNPRLTAYELVATLCDELGIKYPKSPKSLKVLYDRLNAHLLEAHSAGRRTVLIIDESQNLSADTLEQVRLLTNLETNKHKLLQIILIGQPELREMLDRAELRQLSQRVTARFHLPPLNLQETAAYIDHRLAVVGLDRQLFSESTKRRVFEHSGGVPRLINSICDRALLGVYAEDRAVVDRRIVDRAAAEVTGKSPPRKPSLAWASALLSVMGLAVGYAYWQTQPAGESPVLAANESTTPAATQWQSKVQPLPAPSEAEPQLPAESESAPEIVATPAPVAEPDVALVSTAPAEQMLPSISAAAPDNTEQTALPVNKVLDQEERVRVDSTSQLMARQQAQKDNPELAPEVNADRPERPKRASEQVRDPLTAVLQAAAAARLEKVLEELFVLWQLDYGSLDGVSPCQRATAAKLDCIQGHATLKRLRILDRPAIIELAAPEAGSVFVLLVGLNEMSAQIQTGGERFNLSLEQLARIYTGDYFALWHPPVPGMRLLQPGMRGNDVLWLRERLARLNPAVETTGDTTFFDSRLQQQLKAFQREHGLQADGLVGSMTLIAMNNQLNGAAVPKLSR